MAYLRSRVVNLLNLHYGIQALATNAGGVFVIVYLLKAGVSVPVVLSAWALIMGGRFAIRPIVLALGKRTGIKPLVVFGTVATASQYLMLPFVHGADPALLGLCLAGAISDVFYWTSYHAYFAALGDDESRGRQTSARESLAALIGIVAPILGGWVLAAFGARAAFGAVALVQALSALPFLGTPNVAVPKAAPGAYRAAKLGMLLFAADGWVNAGYGIAWQIALFLSLKENLTTYGGATGLAALFGAVAGLALGRQIDIGRGARAVWLSFSAFLFVVLARAASLGIPGLAILANALGAPVQCLYTPVMLAAVYNRAKAAPCSLRFHVAAEGGADVGFGLGCLLAAGMTAIGLSLSLVILTSLAGAIVSFAVLRAHYLRTETREIALAPAK
jgi:DHA1 family inner membrane transport protein